MKKLERKDLRNLLGGLVEVPAEDEFGCAKKGDSCVKNVNSDTPAKYKCCKKLTCPSQEDATCV